MSTKIYNGYILPQESYPELLLAADAARADIRRVGKEVLDRWISRRATELIDNCAAGASRQTFAHGTLASAIQEYVEKEKNAKTYREPQIDVAASFTLHLHRGRFYALVFAENQRIQDMLITLMGAQHFPYWNNTDAPEDLTQEEWDARRDTWEEILGSDAPCDRGPTFEFRAPTPSFSAQNAADHQPDFETRVNRTANLLLLNARVAAVRAEIEADPSMSHFSRIMYQVHEDLKSDAPPDDAMAALLTSKQSLKPCLDANDFTAKIE